jgi:hypothetical protein
VGVIYVFIKQIARAAEKHHPSPAPTVMSGGGVVVQPEAVSLVVDLKQSKLGLKVRI